MSDQSTSAEPSNDKLLPEKPVVAPTPGAATTEAIRQAPRAVRRSMPMALSIGLGILIAVLVWWLARFLILFLLILYLSFIAATILEAPVQWLKRLGIRRSFGAIIVMVGLLGLVVGACYTMANGIYGQVAAVSAGLEKAPERINQYVNGLKRHMPTLAEKMGDFDVAESLKSSFSLSAVWENAMVGFEVATWLVVMFFIVLYMLIDGADHLRGVRSLIPKQSRLEATKLFQEIAKAHRGWALASAFNVASSTLMTGTGLWLLGVPGAWILGFVAGLGELIPNIGPVVGAVPALALTLLLNPEMFWYVLGLIVLVQTIQSYTLTPLMMKFSVELPVLVTIISAIVFGILFGLVGVIVAIPLVADMVVLWRYLNRYMERDTTDYDAVNGPVEGRREPASPDNTPVSRLRKLFRRDRKRNGHAEAPRRPNPSDGLARLDEVEKKQETKGARGGDASRVP